MTDNACWHALSPTSPNVHYSQTMQCNVWSWHCAVCAGHWSSSAHSPSHVTHDIRAMSGDYNKLTRKILGKMRQMISAECALYLARARAADHRGLRGWLRLSTQQAFSSFLYLSWAQHPMSMSTLPTDPDDTEGGRGQLVQSCLTIIPVCLKNYFHSSISSTSKRRMFLQKTDKFI